MSERRPNRIDELSVKSLWITMIRHENEIGHATGFIIESENTNFLFTNWHVVTGCDAETRKRINDEPEELLVWHHCKSALGNWRSARYPLRNSNWDPLWIEHPSGANVDVIALPIARDEEHKYYPINLADAEVDLAVWPANAVSIIGFPHKIASSGKFPVWKTGHVASEIDLDADGKPIFLIDATTKPGMSGSPVFARQTPFYLASDGMTHCGTRHKFLGIYSGHYEKVDVGRVWKPHVLTEIIENARKI